jgi:hypothetical protein
MEVVHIQIPNQSQDNQIGAYMHAASRMPEEHFS